MYLMHGWIDFYISSGFWNLLTTRLTEESVLWLSLGVLVVAALIAQTASRHNRAAMLLYGLYILSLPIAALLGVLGHKQGVDYVALVGHIFLGASLIHFATVLFFDVLLARVVLSLPRIVRDTVTLLAYLIGLLWLVSSRGVNVSGILATSAIITAVIGLSLQDTLGNVVAGLALQLEGKIGVDDWIKIDDHIGRVKEIRWRETSIETRNWDTVLIPNSHLMKGQVTIYGRRENAPKQTRQWIYFNVDFRYSPTEVIEVVNRALQSAPIEAVAQEPKIHAILLDFKDSYCQYAVRYWLTDFAIDDPTNSLIRTRIYFALKRAGIPLSIPAQSIFVTEESRKRMLRKQEEETMRRLEAMRKVDLLKMMTEEELKELSVKLKYSPFSKGEVLTHQGAEAHWLYIIIEGEVSVQVSVNGKSSKEISRLHDGQFFGEMSLITGEPRNATVIALTEVECYRLDKEAFQEILKHRPEIAQEISFLLAARKVERDQVLEDLDEETKKHRLGRAESQFLDSIKNFFGL